MAPPRLAHENIFIRETAVQSREFRSESVAADICVCGGGLAGVCTAITAARNGVSVILLQDRPVLGGNASSEVRLWILGATSHMFNNNRYAREGGLVDEILLENLHRNPEGNPLILDTILLEKVIEEKNIQLFLNTALIGVDKLGDRIAGVTAFCSQTSTLFNIQATQFIDCTGDGVLSFLAGAPFRMGAEQSNEFGELFAPSSEYGHLLGHSIYFYSKDVGRPVKFVAPSYALQNVEDEIPRFKNFTVKEKGCSLWWIEYGGRLDTVHDTEKIKWELWKVVYGVWDYLKNSGRFPEAENLTLEWVGTIPGKRESRRFVGSYMMRQQDIIEQNFHSDAVSFGGWSLDLHPAEGVYSEVDGCTQWHSKGIYQIPFSAMICSEIPNLLYGGRIMSASHVAFASTRVMATCGNNGNALGMATSLCKKLQVDPVQLLEKKNMRMLQQELMKFGQFIPGYKLHDPFDLVRQADSVDTTSAFELSEFPADGPPKVLIRSLAQMIPLPVGRVPNFKVTVQAVEDTTLVVQLRGSEKAYNYTPEVTLAEREFSVPAGESIDITIDFSDVSNPQTQYVFLCFMENEFLAICTTRTRVSGVMTVEHECTQSPPTSVGVDTFERWTPVRRPMGHNLALHVEPPLQAWGVENVRNGVPRPTKRTNCWVPANSSSTRRMLTLRWNVPVQLSRMVLHFDTDYDHALESVLRGHPERQIPFCVKSWRVLDLSSGNEERELFREEDNHLSRQDVSFNPVHTTAIGVEILEVHGDPKHTLGGIFEIRAYE
ncbi:FAD dependent oxidoreductase-domain-containing protein [Aspergillus granulosus]|uniref:FAD dependent oxidoreductase-domain-containing protein n=1 Tax=Aspergillus granulosus TaxID=176169 RepID=A0ABR4GWW7_9EURO